MQPLTGKVVMTMKMEMSMVVVLMAMRIVMMVGKMQTLIPYLTLP